MIATWTCANTLESIIKYLDSKSPIPHPSINNQIPFLAKKSSISFPISAVMVSTAKCPVSNK